MKYTMKSKANMALAASLLLSVSGGVSAEGARDSISIAGSSTVYPFSTVVAENLGKAGKFKTPKVESTGTGGGIKLFCGGVGPQFIDIANASRAIKKSELEACAKAGVTEIVEVKIGFDGIVLAYSKKNKQKLDLSLKEIFLALAKRVPDPAHPEDGTLVDNPYKTWSEINPRLPATKIEVLGPPPTSGTRDAFAELALEGGCKAIPWLKAKHETDEAFFKSTCMTVRQDGAYIEAGENDNLIIQKLEKNADALGIFGFSYLEQNADKIQGALIDGQAPKFDNIASGKYAISRPLFFYVKKAHVPLIPGIEAYIAEFTSEKASGEEGYLADKGLIPLPAAERKKVAADAKALKVMALK
ncbi:PstS family phosphate ABC transporter substrate-binding protein [Candidatus Methylospira mobilis]|nr:PstS family phosphate ABC transporter substrate-binding protein [Candidatus Methylospira mobilis]WNV03541.1 PstS family phosphate ABC transporter substrate-binding protein [Candidatus Methylospira mobilis]